MVTAGQTLSLRVEKPAAGGRMIARVGGQVVLVSGAIPGERVAAQIERVAKGVAYAATVAVEEPSGDRRTPFSDPLCGGCLYGYINYPRQVEIKSLVIADAFQRIGHLQLPGVVGRCAVTRRGLSNARAASPARPALRLFSRGHPRGV